MKPPFKGRTWFGKPVNPKPPPPQPPVLRKYEENGILITVYAPGFARNIESQPSLTPSSRRPRK